MTQPFTAQSQLLMTLKKKPLQNFVGKVQNAGNQHFFPFPTKFSFLPETNLDF